MSLIGKLSHACKVVLPGRLFLRRMIDLSTKVKRLNHWVSLDDSFRSDVAWWAAFLDVWNGCSFMDVHRSGREPDVLMLQDLGVAVQFGSLDGSNVLGMVFGLTRALQRKNYFLSCWQ